MGKQHRYANSNSLLECSINDIIVRKGLRKGLYVVSEALSPCMTALLLQSRPCYSAPPRPPRAHVPQPRNPELLALFQLASVERSAARSPRLLLLSDELALRGMAGVQDFVGQH